MEEKKIDEYFNKIFFSNEQSRPFYCCFRIIYEKETTMKNRSRTEIIASILQVISKRGSTRTKIMYGAFLSYTQLNDYLSFMDQLGLIKYDKDDGHASSNYIVITEKGIHFLSIHDRINQMITTMQVR